jgi:hypothetical protein
VPSDYPPPQPGPKADDCYREMVRRLAPPLPRPIMHHISLQLSRDLQLHRDLQLSAPRAPRGSHDLPLLIEIAQRNLQGINPWAAAGEIAERNGGDARVRHANRKRLYDHYRKDVALYLRIAQASDVEACILEILAEALTKFIEAKSAASALRSFTELNRSD